MTRTIDLRKQPSQQKEAPVAQIIEPEQAASVATLRRRELPPSHFGQPLVWSTSHIRPHRPYAVTILVGVLAAGAALVWYTQHNFLFTLLLLMGACAFVLTPRPKQRTTQVALASEGIVVNDVSYRYHQLHSFWIHYIPGSMEELSIETAHWYLPYVKIPLGKIDPNHVRDFLLERLPEKEHRTSLVDAFLHHSGL
jgi:hypothetical protein